MCDIMPMPKTMLDNSKSLYCSLCETHCRFNCLSIFEEENYDEIYDWVKTCHVANCPKTIKDIVENLTYRDGKTLTVNEMW